MRLVFIQPTVRFFIASKMYAYREFKLYKVDFIEPVAMAIVDGLI